MNIADKKALIISVLVTLISASLVIKMLTANEMKPCSTHNMFNPEVLKFVLIPLFCLILVIVIQLHAKLPMSAGKPENQPYIKCLKTTNKDLRTKLPK